MGREEQLQLGLVFQERMAKEWQRNEGLKWVTVPRPMVRARRRPRAGWWFRQMHGAVDEAA